MPQAYTRELMEAAAPLRKLLGDELGGLVDDIIGIADCLDIDDRLQAAEDMAGNLRKLIDEMEEEAIAGYDRRNNWRDEDE